MPHSGTLLCVASAAAFGAMAAFGKLAYAEGSTVATLLATRFVLAAAVLWVALAWAGGLRRHGDASVRRLPRRDVAAALALGAVGYGAQAGCYFTALGRIDASLLSLLVYTFPVIVTVAAVVLGRDRPSRRTGVALALATVGLALALSGAASGALDPLGAGLGLAAAVTYSAYILVSEGVVGRMPPLTLTTLVCTGAAVTLTASGLATGELRPGDVSVAGLGWLAALALVSTAGAIGLFLAGLARVGPSVASIVSTVEPVVTIALAAAVFGEALTATQLAGAALVLVAAVAVRTTPAARPDRPPSPSPAPARAPAPASV
jgi:drug/metabolite transporter (DMT)-like permease